MTTERKIPYGTIRLVVTSFDPRTGEAVEDVGPETSADDVARLCSTAIAATAQLEALGRRGRAAMLRAMADALEADRELLVETADRETALGAPRLNSELTRTVFQLRFFAEVIDDGAYLEATIDHAGDTAMGPRPDLRKLLRPIGPVGVFGASNFPFAFSVPGGDTASALAAGCAVVIKGHEAHPRTSQLCASALRQGAAAVGVTEDVVSLVLGRDAGTAVVLDPNIRAVGFTGSLGGGRALHDLASIRSSPIPFYGELGALNPLVVCPSAAQSRPTEIATGLANSFTLGVGQFCTKPGLAFVPAGSQGDTVVAALAEAVNAKSAGVMLNARVQQGFADGTAELVRLPGITRVATAQQQDWTQDGWWGTPLLLEASAAALDGAVLDECFGPVLVIVRYGSDDELLDLLSRVGPALTASIHADDGDLPVARRLIETFSGRVGRVVWNGYPTGVAVAWAMHHGGPYPATTDALHTSVGASSIRRWLRPVAYQDVPQHLLPAELVDAPEAAYQVPRRVDGHLDP
jgi:NADP-dependent aldehyde dehydrogenase